MNVEIINRTRTRVPKSFILSWIDKVEKELLRQKTTFKKSQRHLDLTIAFVTDQQMKMINKKFRKKNKVTDILSFSSTLPNHLGELILSPNLVKKQARDVKLPFRMELGYLLLHGILHLLGYDHEKKDSDAKKMFKIQDTIFKRLYPRL